MNATCPLAGNSDIDRLFVLDGAGCSLGCMFRRERTDYEQRGELLAAVELRRLFASAATLFLRSPPVEQSFRKCCPEWAVFNYVTITEPARLSGNPIKPS